MHKVNVSFCIGVYNEKDIILQNLKKLKKGLNEIPEINKYEIIIVDNGSTDKTPDLLKKINDKCIRPLFLSEKGLGLAFNTAIKNSQFECIALSAIDIPFGFSDLENALQEWEEYDLIFGSKAHSKSKVNALFSRKVASVVYRFLLKLFFNVNIKDTQGTVFMKRSSVLFLLKYCTSKNAFFNAQLAIYGQQFHFKMKEIPVILSETQKIRKSKYNIFKDGSKMLFSILKEYFIYKKVSCLKF